jgi:hypothetical protein
MQIKEKLLMNTSKILSVFSVALSFATAANANGHFFLNESNYCASSDDIVLRLESWPIQFGPVSSILLTPQIYEESPIAATQLLLVQISLLQRGMLDAQKAAALSYTALSANASDVTRQSALSILSTSGLSVDFYPERLIACAFDCSSGGVSRISSEFEICVSME